jgi:Trp operon repressor
MKVFSHQLRGIAHLLIFSQEEGKLLDTLSLFMTEREIKNIYERIKIVECLNNGLSQRKTCKKTGVAIATVSHGAKILKQTLFMSSLLQKVQRLDWWRHLFWRI